MEIEAAGYHSGGIDDIEVEVMSATETEYSEIEIWDDEETAVSDEDQEGHADILAAIRTAVMKALTVGFFGGITCSPQSTEYSTSSTSAGQQRSSKRRKMGRGSYAEVPQNGHPGDPNDDNEDGGNSGMNQGSPQSTAPSHPPFACPFFKHDPGRYNVTTSNRACAGPGYGELHRLR
jgi:hypothetical protein